MASINPILDTPCTLCTCTGYDGRGNLHACLAYKMNFDGHPMVTTTCNPSRQACCLQANPGMLECLVRLGET